MFMNKKQLGLFCMVLITAIILTACGGNNEANNNEVKNTAGVEKTPVEPASAPAVEGPKV